MTADGSHSIITGDGVAYHSTFGAVQESRHIFIGAGLLPVLSGSTGPIAVFEMGFGTGLNTLLTLMAASGRPIRYETVELSPLPMEMVRRLNYCEGPGKPDWQPVFERMHSAAWGQEVEIVPGFRLLKVATDGAAYRPRQAANLIYYDAFDPVAQPELWEKEVVQRMAEGMAPGGVLVTYCCKGAVRRAMQNAGLVVEKLPGPSGKREILRAKKGDAGI